MVGRVARWLGLASAIAALAAGIWWAARTGKHQLPSLAGGAAGATGADASHDRGWVSFRAAGRPVRFAARSRCEKGHQLAVSEPPDASLFRLSVFIQSDGAYDCKEPNTMPGVRITYRPAGSPAGASTVYGDDTRLLTECTVEVVRRWPRFLARFSATLDKKEGPGPAKLEIVDGQIDAETDSPAACLE